jgi:hypothetical protein
MIYYVLEIKNEKFDFVIRYNKYCRIEKDYMKIFFSQSSIKA